MPLPTQRNRSASAIQGRPFSTDAPADGDGYVFDTGLGLFVPSGSRALRESGGPTRLPIAAVADGEYLKRVGSSVVGSRGVGRRQRCRVEGEGRMIPIAHGTVS